MKKKHIIYTLSTIPLTIALCNVNDSNAFFGLDSFISKNKTANDIVNIRDKNLLKAINNQLGRGEVLDSVTVADMESLTTLMANDRNIHSIEGLQYATNLLNLNLSKNNIVDISKLGNLKKLSMLSIFANQIEDISCLKNLTSLKTLYLGYQYQKGNNISDISALSYLKNLEKLNLDRNKVSDISFLSDLTNLKELSLEYNVISNIDDLAKLTNLVYLNLGDNDIEDISVIFDFTKLNCLKLSNNNISNIDVLMNINTLSELNLDDNSIENIEPLSNITSLKKIYLNNNNISNIDSLSSITNLEQLQLSRNNISNIDVLMNMNTLNELNLSHNSIENIEHLSNITSLKKIYLNNNNITSIKPLESLVNLDFLEISDNNIEDISVVENLELLTTLYINNNNISDISNISELINLKHLRFSGNNIEDISALKKLVKLETLWISQNNIKDISVLKNHENIRGELRMNDNKIKDISPLAKSTGITTIFAWNNEIEDISVIDNFKELTWLSIYHNKIADISPVKNLKKISRVELAEQNPVIEVVDFKTETDKLDISINNPIVGLNNKNLNISSISNNGLYENGKLKWNNLPLGSHAKTFNFLENVTVGSTTATFNGTATLNFNVVDGGAPESDHTSDFDSDDFGIYTTVTANDLGVGVDYLMHKGVRQQLPYRFKYDILEPSNNVVEVYDLVGNKAEYQVKLKDSDIPAIEEGLDALVNKDNSEKEDISYFRKIINDLDESMNKDLFQDRLNDIYPKTLTLDRELTTSNMDVYIKSENILQMALDTNSITFEDFSGVEDIIKENVVNVSINSSLPYQLNAYLPVEIQNTDKTNTMDKSILNIKENSESNYQVFPNTTDKIILKDNCSAGNDLVHGVDIKLSGGISHEKDVYKTTIKFEVEQK